MLSSSLWASVVPCLPAVRSVDLCVTKGIAEELTQRESGVVTERHREKFK
jgi:hypothetical protein